jgi:hypothetical protein
MLTFENGAVLATQVLRGVQGREVLGGRRRRCGCALGEIVRAHPHITGKNFDLPHVIAAAPQIQGERSVLALVPATNVHVSYILVTDEVGNSAQFTSGCDLEGKEVGSLV